VKLLTINNLKKGKNVVLDATNIDTIYRTPFVDSVNNEVEFKKIALVFYVSREEAKQRIRKDIENGIDRANVPFEIIDSQYNRYMDSLKNLPGEGFKIVTSWNEN
jgi:predicted kinase